MEQQEGSRLTLLARTRMAAKALSANVGTAKSRADVCLDLLSPAGLNDRLEAFRRSLHSLPVDERHYWIGTLYR